jgi:site-specific recombinase XerD
MPDKQLELFPNAGLQGLNLPQGPDLRPTDSLGKTMEPFTEYMQQKGFAENTIASFLGDMGLLIKFLGPETALDKCSTQQLERFLDFIRTGRGVPCSPKSLDRRITTLKVFFGWLAEKSVLPNDPAAPLVHYGARSPLPTILVEEQIREVLRVTKAMRDAEEAPDARPHLLITLLLATAIKKAECMRIELHHIDLSDAAQPSVYIHYDKPRQRFKTRRLALPADWPQTLEVYLRRYQPKERLFECTPRNLEYVLHNISTLAYLANPMTFEMLRWTSATQSLREGMDEERLRKRLGLSRIAWQETLPILQKLAEGPL